MKTNSYNLLNELLQITRQNIQDIKTIENLDDSKLNFKPLPEKWSILECLEHLNRYFDFYLPEIKKALDNSADTKEYFRSGFIGNMLVNMVTPKPDGKKMKTFAAMNPTGSILDRQVMSKNMENLQIFMDYIQNASKSNLNKKGIPVTFSRFIKLNLGDTLRFMAYHNQRHIAQAMRNVR